MKKGHLSLFYEKGILDPVLPTYMEGFLFFVLAEEGLLVHVLHLKRGSLSLITHGKWLLVPGLPMRKGSLSPPTTRLQE